MASPAGIRDDGSAARDGRTASGAPDRPTPAAVARRPAVAVVITPALREELLGPAGWAELNELADVVADCRDGSELAAHPRRGEAEVLVCSWGSPRLTEELLGRLPRLSTVLPAAGSVRGLAGDTVWERGITVVSAADANNEPVADYVLAQTVLALKDVHRRSRRIVTERALPPLEDVPGIRGRTVGLVSFGSVAQKAARRLHRIGTEVLAWDPYQGDEVFRAEGVTRVARLPELIARSAVLSVHTPPAAPGGWPRGR
ncbi:NAD(P)-dependent oxidoreductase [Streptomyces sp. NPDC088812]|uniref:NAD(P)-dependent oxidoreductase n=1 Tax=Streptomyces sp. NPDC088812 TaxID=3365905 RepID=UPI0037F1D94E